MDLRIKPQSIEMELDRFYKKFNMIYPWIYIAIMSLLKKTCYIYASKFEKPRTTRISSSSSSTLFVHMRFAQFEKQRYIDSSNASFELNTYLVIWKLNVDFHGMIILIY